MASDHGEVVGRELVNDRDREGQLFQILAAYFEAIEAGQAPDRAEWLTRYPEWTDEIAGFLDDQERLLRLTEPLRAIDQPTTGFIPGTELTDGSARYVPRTKVRYLGDYELIEEIARGGMGVVFRARQRSLNRPVALKMLLTDSLASETDEARFRREAEAAANLDHSNIVPIFEVGRHDGYSYFSMKLIEGGNLSKRLHDFASDQRAAARLMAKVARAVHHAHERGVLHRDLKPSNILLSGGPDTPIGQLEPHVTDFGLARRVEGDSDLTLSGAILGTPSYIAPEQASGKRLVVTITTDVYGIGAVLYAILSGRPPFQGDSVLETLAQVKDRALEPPSRHGRRIDRDLETICLKCLEKETGRRYQSAEAVAEDLERWLAGEPILARPSGRVERTVRWGRRNPVVAALVATASLLLLATTMAVIVLGRARQTTERLNREVRHRERAARQQAYIRDLKQASEMLGSNRPSWAIDLLARHGPAPGEDDLRDFAWHYLWGAAHLGNSPLRGHAGEVYRAAFSPDGKTLATAGQDRTVRLWDVGERRPRLILPDRSDGPSGHGYDINWVTFSPDGKVLATASDDHTVKLWDAGSGRLRLTLAGHHDLVVSVLFTPDGRQLISCARQGKVILWDLETSRERSSFTVSNGTLQSLAVSPDGAFLAIAGSQVVIRDLNGGRTMLPFGAPDDQVNGIAFSHDGKTLAGAGHSGTVRLWDVPEWRLRTGFYGHGTTVQSVAFAPDDRTLASVDDSGIARLWDSTTGAYDTIMTGQARLWCVAFSADGRTLATTSQDATIRLWDMVRDRPRIAIRRRSTGVPSIAFSADGKTLTAADEAGTVWTFDARQGRPIAIRPFQASTPTVSAALSRDASLLATAGADRTIAIWDLQDGRRVRAFTASSWPLKGLSIAQGGGSVALAGKDGRAMVRDAESDSEEAFAIGDASGIVFGPRGDCLAISSRNQSRPAFWDLATGRPRIAEGLGHKGGIIALTFSPDGRILATCGEDRTIVLWDCQSSQETHPLFGHTDDVTCLAFSPSGRILASGSLDRTVRLWDVASQTEITTLTGHSSVVRQITFSPDGLTLATRQPDRYGLRIVPVARQGRGVSRPPCHQAQGLVRDPTADEIGHPDAMPFAPSSSRRLGLFRNELIASFMFTKINKVVA